MQITLGYSDVEAAIRNYVKTIGIDKEVTEINVIQQRKAGEPIKVELTLDTFSAPIPTAQPTPRATVTEAVTEVEEAPVEAVAEEAEKAEDSESQSVSRPTNLFNN
jgi:hypothetical protein